MRETAFNPDSYMADLRHILSSGRKRIGLLLGAGAPMSMPQEPDSDKPLIPDVEGLTDDVMNLLSGSDCDTIATLTNDITGGVTVETILTRVRKLASAIGSATVHDLDGPEYTRLAETICHAIGQRVAVSLPSGQNPYSHLVSWIAGTHRDHSVEIFTPNYDLLIEEAFERARVPYFDGFIGSRRAFFSPSSVATDVLPSRWSLLWKLHGSLGWALDGDTFVRTGKRTDTRLIYPDHLKYDEIGRLPYSAFFDRLRRFLVASDTLLICSGFSFRDSHICSVILESLATNKHTAVLAFQYGLLETEASAVQCAQACPNLSVYARDGAVMSGVIGSWELGLPENTDWENIRRMFWVSDSDGGTNEFVLGDFARLAHFLALAVSPTGHNPDPSTENTDSEREESA